MHENPEIYFVTVVGVILGLLLTGFIITMLFLYRRRQHRQEQELARLKDQYEREALRSQLEIQELAFKTMGQELHDNIGQMLSVAKLTLSALPLEPDHPGVAQLDHTKEVLNKAIFDLSNLTKSLHTDRITQIGLAECIRFEVYSLRKAGIVSVHFNQEGHEEEFNEQRSVFLFRIFQEALNNVLKHSKATEVIVNLKYLEDIFVMEISDNGVGFNVKEKLQAASSYSGVGLRSIFNRAKLIGAELTISSERTGGTVVQIELSLRSQ